jgi:nitroreductase
MKMSIKRLLNLIIYFFSMIRLYTYDFVRYIKASPKPGLSLNKTQFRAMLLMNSHCIEKGLCLPEPRPGFGFILIKKLFNSLTTYEKKFGQDYISKVVFDIISAHEKWNREIGVNDYPLDKHVLVKHQSTQNSCKFMFGGADRLSKKSVHENSLIDLRDFFKSRRSIRNFSEEEVDLSFIKRAVTMAQHTPSQCNRQPWKVYVFSGIKKKELISQQKGNRGFGDKCNKLLVVTTKLSSFFGPLERQQYAIDGGMFSMSIIYTLHSLGLGACPLAWAVQPREEKKFHNTSKIPYDERIIMLIAIGHLKEHFSVAKAHKKPLNEILIIDDSNNLIKKDLCIN